MTIVTVDGKQVPRADGEQHLLRIIGMTNLTKSDVGDNGPYTAFHGAFEATNISTGEVYTASVCFLPESVTGILSVAVNAEAGRNVEFAVDLGCKPANTNIGYEYTITPLIESEELNPLRHLKTLLAKTAPLKLANASSEAIGGSDAEAESEPAPAQKTSKKK